MHPLLDNYLCKKYPLIFSERNLPMIETCMCWGFDHGDGWFFLLDNLCNSIQSYISNHNTDIDCGYIKEKERIPQVVATQVKEKWGTLHFYYRGGNDYIRGMIDFAQNLSYSTCEICGVMDISVGRTTKGWIRTTCEKHTRNKEVFRLNGDKELQEIWGKIKEEECTITLTSLETGTKIQAVPIKPGSKYSSAGYDPDSIPLSTTIPALPLTNVEVPMPPVKPIWPENTLQEEGKCRRTS